MKKQKDLAERIVEMFVGKGYKTSLFLVVYRRCDKPMALRLERRVRALILADRKRAKGGKK